MEPHGFDVIVVGSGSAGGVIAPRLSEDPGCEVMLLEAGPDFPDELDAPPLFFSTGTFLAGSAWSGLTAHPDFDGLDWSYASEPLPTGRRVPLPRGKLVGGTSMINGTVWVRGRPQDFERWVADGADGWGWDTMRRLYERVEQEVPAMVYSRSRWLPDSELLISACEELGFRYRADLNAPDAWDGVVGRWPRNRRRETRMGTLTTYIRNARARPNLTIRDRATAARVLLDGSHATGIEYIDHDGRAERVFADRVVLSAGTYGTPAILMRSGIGPAEELRRLGIEPVVDLPVGQGLMDHPATAFRVRAARDHVLLGWPSLAAVVRGTGWLAFSVPLDDELGQIAITFALANTEGPANAWIRLASTDPTAAPLIEHGYMSVIDAGGFDGVWQHFQRLLETDVFRRAHVVDEEPGVPLSERLLATVVTGAHPAGGCSIGRVVDPQLSVYGIEGLTVADASVFPHHTTNNPNMTVFAVGERAAELISQNASVAATTRT